MAVKKNNQYTYAQLIQGLSIQAAIKSLKGTLEAKLSMMQLNYCLTARLETTTWQTVSLYRCKMGGMNTCIRR
jgi:hypothetical protein